jgi:hypothetical protein
MTTEKFAEPGWITADIEPAVVTPVDGSNPRSAVRRAAHVARSRASAGADRLRTEGPQRVRQAGQTVTGNPVPVAAAALLAALGAVAVVVTSRRRAAARAAAKSGRLAFLRRSR